MTYRSTKTYGHSVGLSCAFRQWRAESHCAQVHGYALAVHVVFEATDLDSRGWVVDFGALKPFKAALEALFDHKTLVAEDDPHLAWFQESHRLGIMHVIEVPATGCEAFANMVLGLAARFLEDQGLAPRCRVVSAEVREHEGNSAMVLA